MKFNKHGITILCAGVALFVMVQPARAIFGAFDVVFDPSAFATLGDIWSSDVSTGAKIVEEVNQLTKIYTTAYSMYTTAEYMKSRFTAGTKDSMMLAAQGLVNNYTRNQYGETVLWPQMMNGSPSLAPQAWANSTVAVQSNPYLTSPLANGVPGASSALAMLAFVEQVDGSSVGCLQNISQYKQNAQANQQPISFFHMTMTDDSDSTGSLIEQLALGNMARVHANTEQRAQGSINTCMAEQQVLANKITRDEIAASMNNQATMSQTLASPAMQVNATTNPWGTRIP